MWGSWKHSCTTRLGLLKAMTQVFLCRGIYANWLSGELGNHWLGRAERLTKEREVTGDTTRINMWAWKRDNKRTNNRIKRDIKRTRAESTESGILWIQCVIILIFGISQALCEPYKYKRVLKSIKIMCRTWHKIVLFTAVQLYKLFWFYLKWLCKTDTCQNDHKIPLIQTSS